MGPPEPSNPATVQHIEPSPLLDTAVPTAGMAAGEYVSVSSQRDAEDADIQRTADGRAQGPAAEAEQLRELTENFEEQGLPHDLAKQVGPGC